MIAVVSPMPSLATPFFAGPVLLAHKLPSCLSLQGRQRPGDLQPPTRGGVAATCWQRIAMQERKSEQPPRGEGKWRHGEVELVGREALEVSSTYEAKAASIKGKHQYCSTCWLPLPVCCCQTLSAEQKSALQTLQERQPVEISLYMHVKEFLRKSNTGALIQCAHPLLPTSIFIAGQISLKM